MTGRPRSLKSRALQLLAQREQSRVELRRKLMAHAASEGAARLDGAVDTDAGAGVDTDAGAEANTEAVRDRPPGEAAAQVDAVLAWLEANRFMSDQRFAESRAQARAPRYGNLRIRQELKQHGVALPDETARQLQDTEGQRALAVWERRFGQAPQTAAEAAKQARFLTARGFPADIVRRVVRARRDAGKSSASAEGSAGAADAPGTGD